MTLTAATRTPVWCDASTLAGQDARLGVFSALLSGLGTPASSPLAIGSGVRDGTGNPLQVAVSAGLSVSVNTGCSAIQGTGATNAGAYEVTLDTAALLTCTAADTVNSRIDSVCLTVTDNGTAPFGVVQIITGTPAASPTAPTLPSNSLLLCNITVAANATTLISANLADSRQFLAAAGGIKPYLKSSFWPTSGGSAMYLHDIATSRLKRLNGSGVVVAPSTVAFAPAYGSTATVSANSTTAVTVSSTSVTVDGSTDVKITISWKYITTSGTSPGNNGQLNVTRGGSVVDDVVLPVSLTNGTVVGGTKIYYDNAPAAGTYTYTLSIQNQGAGTFTAQGGRIVVEAVPS